MCGPRRLQRTRSRCWRTRRCAAGWRARRASSWTARARCASPPRSRGLPRPIDGIRQTYVGRVFRPGPGEPHLKMRPTYTSLRALRARRRYLLLRQRERNRDRTMHGIIFDLDDTLYPRERFIHSGMAAVSRNVEQAWSIPADAAFATLFHATTRGRRGMEFQELCQRHSLPTEALPGLVQVFRSHLPNLWPSHGAVAMLQALRAEGWRIAILTNGLPHVQAAKIRALGLRALVDHIVYAEEYAEGG